MNRRMDLEEILRQNPQINEQELDKAREMLRRLQDQGVHRKEYDLIPPFGGRRVTVLDDVRANSLPSRVRRP